MGEQSTPPALRFSGQLVGWLVIAVGGAAVLVAVLLRPEVDLTTGNGVTHTAVGTVLTTVRFEPLAEGLERVTTADLDGRVAVIDFWGTWCPPCREELPHMVALHDKFRADDRFRLFAVSCSADSPASVDELRLTTRRFLDEQRLELPVYADPDGYTRQGGQLLGWFEGAFPTTVVTDPTRRIRGVWVGYRAGVEREIETLVAALLAE